MGSRHARAAGWAVRDQVSHLAFFDDAARSAIVDPAAFTVAAEAALAAGGDPMEEHLRRGRAMPGRDVLAWWRDARRQMVGAARTLDARDRVPWFGPPMGALSFVSARLMETWAHGQDVADALGVTRVPTATPAPHRPSRGASPSVLLRRARSRRARRRRTGRVDGTVGRALGVGHRCRVGLRAAARRSTSASSSPNDATSPTPP